MHEVSFEGKLEYADLITFVTPIEVTGVRSMDGSDANAAPINMSHLRSPVVPFEPGRPMDGPFSFEVLYDSTLYDQLSTMFFAKTKKFWRVTTPSGAKLVDSAWISTLGRPRLAEDSAIVFNLSVHCTLKWAHTVTP